MVVCGFGWDMVNEIVDESTSNPPLSRTAASQMTRGAQSYYYWHGDAERRRAAAGEKPAPLPTPQKLQDEGTTYTHAPKPLVSMAAELSATPAVPAQQIRAEHLFVWSKYVSPPRGWPGVFTESPAMKQYVKNLKGRRMRLTEPPSALELERVITLQAQGILSRDSRANAIAVRQALGWEVMGGVVLLELSQGLSRSEAVSSPLYHAEPHWWNVTPRGLWVDFTPREHRKLVLVETAVPTPS